MTFYDRIIMSLSKNKHSIDDIVWIGNNELCFEKNQFISLAKKITDKGMVALDFLPNQLMLVGKDFWLEKKQDENIYDFSEDCWIYKQMPTKPTCSDNQLVNFFTDAEMEYLYNNYGYSDNFTNEEIISFLNR